MQFNLADQRAFFASGATMSLDFRRQQLKKLETVIKRNDYLIYEALRKDLNKNMVESYTTEIAFVYHEIKYMLKHMNKWMKPKRVPTPIVNFYARSYIYQQPYGTVLIISPWNYPFQLSFVPLIGAIAAGNCAVVKPSEMAPHTSAVIRKIIREAFDPAFVAVEEGDGEISQAILSQGVDYCFFTGSSRVGRKIMQATSEHLTPVTLELGGKSPTIVTRDVNPKHAARRIVWGKFINAGQTCIAPDYLLVDEGIRDALLGEMINAIREFYGSSPETNPDYPRIINQKHFKRLRKLLAENTVAAGGQVNEARLTIAPSLILDPDLSSDLMTEEIFGPLLPVVTYSNIHDALAYVRAKPKPLALYLFTNNQQLKEYVITHMPFGGGAINDTLMHLSNPHLPFGGIGASGMGRYHGKFSLETFSHSKAVLDKTDSFDINLRYPPYSKAVIKLIQKLM